MRRGYGNHKRFCQDAIKIEDAEVKGRTYRLGGKHGYPVLTVPEQAIIAKGTDNLGLDMYREHKASELMLAYSDDNTDDWNVVRGELITLDRPWLSLPPIDTLEGFYPDYPNYCLYKRVLVPVFLVSAGLYKPAWCYIAGDLIELPNKEKAPLFALERIESQC